MYGKAIHSHSIHLEDDSHLLVSNFSGLVRHLCISSRIWFFSKYGDLDRLSSGGGLMLEANSHIRLESFARKASSLADLRASVIPGSWKYFNMGNSKNACQTVSPSLREP